MRLLYAVMGACLLLILAACGSSRLDRGLSGAAIGAGTGAAVGALTGTGMTSGALLGGAAGGATGASHQQAHHRPRPTDLAPLTDRRELRAAPAAPCSPDGRTQAAQG